MFSLWIKTDNAAFCDDDGKATAEARGRETARILRQLAAGVEQGGTAGAAYDLNGNRIGEWGFDEDPEDDEYDGHDRESYSDDQDRENYSKD